MDANDRSSYRRLAAIHRNRSDFAAAIRVLTDALSSVAGATDDQTQLELIWTLLDPDNLKHRDNQRANETANRIHSQTENADTILTKVLIQIELGKTKEAIA